MVNFSLLFVAFDPSEPTWRVLTDVDAVPHAARVSKWLALDSRGRAKKLYSLTQVTIRFVEQSLCLPMASQGLVGLSDGRDL